MNVTKDEAIQFLNSNPHFTKVNDSIGKIPKYLCDIAFDESDAKTISNNIDKKMHELFPGDWQFIYGVKTQLASKPNISILSSYDFLEEMEIDDDFIDIYFKLNK